MYLHLLLENNANVSCGICNQILFNELKRNKIKHNATNDMFECQNNLLVLLKELVNVYNVVQETEGYSPQ